VLAGALTLAVAGALFQHVLVDDTRAHEPVRTAYTSALSAATWVLVGLCAIGAVLTWAFVRDVEPGAHREHGRHLPFHWPTRSPAES
jgi:hypothetical protein